MLFTLRLNSCEQQDAPARPDRGFCCRWSGVFYSTPPNVATGVTGVGVRVGVRVFEGVGVMEGVGVLDGVSVIDGV